MKKEPERIKRSRLFFLRYDTASILTLTVGNKKYLTKKKKKYRDIFVIDPVKN